MAANREQSDREFVDAVLGPLPSIQIPPVPCEGSVEGEVIEGEVVSVRDRTSGQEQATT